MAGGLKRLVAGQSNIDFIGRSKIWAAISAFVIIGSLIALFKPGLTFGLEFEGGSYIRVPVVGEQVDVEAVEEAITEFNLSDASIQLLQPGSCETPTTSGTCQTVEIRTREALTDLGPVRTVMADLAGQKDVGNVDSNVVGPSWGQQVSKKALRGLIVFLILVTIYISLRFEPKMAAGALSALMHDLIATAGIYAMTGLTVSPATVVALLTLMGFSLYDTVVVFDRVSENAAGIGVKESYGQMVNRSMNEVLIRSINTSVSSILPVAGLLFVGVFLLNAETLKDLAVAMFIGTAVSIYSSIFVAAPILAALKEREPRYQALRDKARALAGTSQTSLPAETPESQESTPSASKPTTPSKTASGRQIRPRRQKRR